MGLKKELNHSDFPISPIPHNLISSCAKLFQVKLPSVELEPHLKFEQQLTRAHDYDSIAIHGSVDVIKM